MVASSGGKFQNDFILLYLLYKITLKLNEETLTGIIGLEGY